MLTFNSDGKFENLVKVVNQLLRSSWDDFEFARNVCAKHAGIETFDVTANVGLRFQQMALVEANRILVMMNNDT